MREGDAIETKPLTAQEVKEILRMTENETGPIISFKSKAFRKLNIDWESLQLQDLYKIIKDNPSMLRRPIIKDEKRLNVGFNNRRYVASCLITRMFYSF